jgi:tetratricopeptide (TPR) repeat protein
MFKYDDKPLATHRRITMADHALRQTDIQPHRSSRWLRRHPIFLALLALAATLLPTDSTTFLPASAAVAAPFQTGDPVADSVLPQEEDTAKRPEVAEAIKKLQNNDVPGALESFEAASAKYPDLAPAPVIMAGIYLRSGGANAVQPAHALLDQAVAEHPQDPEAYLVLGALALRSQLKTEAALLFERGNDLIASFKGDASRLKRFRGLSASGLANVAELKRDWETAEKHLRDMVAIGDDNASAHQRLGRALFMLGSSDQREEAYTEFKRAAELNDQMPKAEVAIGQLYAVDDQEGSAKKALEWHNYAVETNPQHVPTRIQVAQHLVNIGDIEGALVHAEEANKLAPESKEARLALGQVNRYLGNHEAAQALFESVYLESPTDFSAVNWLALSLADQDNPDKRKRALELIDIVLKNLPANDANRAEAIATAGWVYHQLNDNEKAEQALASAVNSRRVGQDAYYHLALVLTKKGDNAKAKTILEMALNDKSAFIYRRDAEKLLAELQ